MAALRPSMDHIGSLSAPTVAEGLNTISAPLRPSDRVASHTRTLLGQVTIMWHNRRLVRRPLSAPCFSKTC